MDGPKKQPSFIRFYFLEKHRKTWAKLGFIKKKRNLKINWQFLEILDYDTYETNMWKNYVVNNFLPKSTVS